MLTALFVSGRPFKYLLIIRRREKRRECLEKAGRMASHFLHPLWLPPTAVKSGAQVLEQTDMSGPAHCATIHVSQLVTTSALACLGPQNRITGAVLWHITEMCGTYTEIHRFLYNIKALRLNSIWPQHSCRKLNIIIFK